MANRYWIGGAGNWNDPAHWSATSGGVGGASVPTMDDDVYFDSNSGTGTVTVNAIANMRDCTFAQTQLITLTNAAYAFNIYGNWTLCSNTYLNTSFTGTGCVYLKSTTSVNITSNGCTRAWNRLYFDGVGGTWTNQDDWSIGSTSLFLINGEYYSNNYTITSGGYQGLNRVTGKIYFGSSIINCINIVNFTVNSLDVGTSIVTLTSFQTGGINWNVVNVIGIQLVISGGGGSIRELNIIGTGVSTLQFYINISITDILTFQGLNSTTQRLLVYSSSLGTPRTITCNGTVTASNVDFRDIVGAGTANWDLSAIEGGSGDCGGNSGITFTPAQTQYFKSRGLEKIPNIIDREFSSDTGWWAKGTGWSIVDGVARANPSGSGASIEKSAYLTTGKTYKVKFSVLNYVQGYCFLYIGNNISPIITSNGDYEFTLVAGNGFVGIRGYTNFIGDIDNFSIIQLDACEWSDNLNWFTDISPRLTQGRVPLPQDDAIFDENSFTGASTLTVNVPRIGGLNMEGVDKSLTFSPSLSIECYSNFILGQNITSNGNYGLYLLGRDAKSINVFEKQICGSLNFYTYFGYLTILSNMVLSASFVNDICGVSDFNGYNLTCNKLYGQFSVHHNISTPALILRNGTFLINSTSGESFYGASGGGVDASQATLIFNAATGGANININPINTSQFYKVVFSGLHTGYYEIIGSRTINELIIDPGRKVHFTNGSTQTINKLTAIGTPEQPITIGSTTAGQRHTINYTGSEASTVEYCNISDSKVTQARRLLAKNSVNGGNNQNWGFDTLPALTLNKKQVDKIYAGDKLVTAIYKGTAKIY